MNEFLDRNYNPEAIANEIKDPKNIYYLINYKDQPAGFSKIVLNARHDSIAAENVAILDRIYLAREFYGLKLGLELLNFNIELAKQNNQSGMWLYVWIGNKRAVDFYLKAGFKIIGSHKYYVTKTHYDVSHHLFLNFFGICAHRDSNSWCHPNDMEVDNYSFGRLTHFTENYIRRFSANARQRC